MTDFFDTCVFIDYWKGDSAAISIVNTAKSAPNSVLFSSVSAVELWQYSGLGRKEEIEYIGLTKFFLKEAPLTLDAGMIAGQWLRPHSRNKRRRLMADALISATASLLGATIYSRNCKDLLKFYGNVVKY